MLVLVLVITVIGSFQVFDTVAVTTKGGPVNASRVIQLLHLSSRPSTAPLRLRSAISVVLFLILVVVAVVQLRLLRGSESDLA